MFARQPASPTLPTADTAFFLFAFFAPSETLRAQNLLTYTLPAPRTIRRPAPETEDRQHQQREGRP